MISNTMQLQLFHGRLTATETPEDWGFQAPRIINITYFLTTYETTYRVGFADRESALLAQEQTGWKWWDETGHCLEFKTVEGMIETKDGFYGDWEFATNFEDWHGKPH